MTAASTHYHTAQLELARRELERRRRATIAATPFGDWLPQVTPEYTWGWAHLVYIRSFLDRVTSGELKKLMIFVPPRHGKSEQTTVRYPVYRMDRDPRTRVIVGCYNTDLATKFSRDARRIAARRGLTRHGLKNTEAEWEVAGGGGFRTAAVGAAPTGRGADLIIIDDPVRSRQDADSETYRNAAYAWYSNDMYTRLEPGGAIILIITRWHEDDLAGRILASEDGPNWTVCSLPAEAEEGDPLGRTVGQALCPERFDEEALAGIRGVLGIDYYALYQQRPVADEGGLYQRDWFVYSKPPATVRGELLFDYILQAWDTASSKLGDYSVCVTAGITNTQVYVLDVFRDRLESPDLKREVERLAESWGPRAILIEDASSGIAIQQMLRRETKLPIIAVPPHKAGKVSHARANAVYFEGGRVIFCPGAYLPALERELLSFPSGTHDDQVDAINVLITRVYAAVASGRAGSHSGSGRG
ncbi:phage terminase large subunit [Oscillochloris sp. ZM17-4]|uniref:phage terminase large subunit n=1 Tax=Oscillochloris sp. ZM17-4 TaxID=2866714 RepID=UPI001C738D3E|nr:phage terminase large subunit [Oscillochloris sp. ZM17-4]MBX0329104.1 phage terminase large subunit [Oscillochloris sp. ZM17-4]